MIAARSVFEVDARAYESQNLFVQSSASALSFSAQVFASDSQVMCAGQAIDRASERASDGRVMVARRLG